MQVKREGKSNKKTIQRYTRIHKNNIHTFRNF